MKKIHKYFEEFKHYLNYTIESMQNYKKYSEDLINHSHIEFNKTLNDKVLILNDLKSKLDAISEFKYDIKKIELTKYGYKAISIHDKQEA
jgi:hypothetical protein